MFLDEPNELLKDEEHETSDTKGKSQFKRLLNYFYWILNRITKQQ